MKKNLLIIFSILFLTAKPACFAAGSNLTVEAQKQSYDEKTKIMNFEGNVKVGFDKVTVKSPKAYLKTGTNGKPETAKFFPNPEAEKIDANTKSKVKANIISVSLLENLVKAEGNADSVILESQTPIVTIKSDVQEFDLSADIITATGNVNIEYKDTKTFSNIAKIKINKEGKPENVNLTGSAKLTQGNNIVNASNFLFNPANNALVASGNVVSMTTLDDATQIKIFSDYQQFEKSSGTLITSGKVKIYYKDYIATGPKATFLPTGNSTKPNKIIFLGRAKIQQGTRIVEADKIQITIDPKNFTAEGNVKSQFTQVQDLKEKRKNNTGKKSVKKTPQDVKPYKNPAIPLEIKHEIDEPELKPAEIMSNTNK